MDSADLEGRVTSSRSVSSFFRYWRLDRRGIQTTPWLVFRTRRLFTKRLLRPPVYKRDRLLFEADLYSRQYGISYYTSRSAVADLYVSTMPKGEGL